MGQRVLYLIRHGHYNSRSQAPERGQLTALGKQQAELTAERLRKLPISVIHHSTMRRARETAEIIKTKLPSASLRASPLLCECIPWVSPAIADRFANFRAEDLEKGGSQAQQAYEKFFKRSRSGERHELLVCHGNIIRYFVCRALQVPPEAWVNTDIYNCGISQVVVEPDGQIMLISHNDTGHLVDQLRTFG